jgi:class 3 adenylate cyclase
MTTPPSSDDHTSSSDPRRLPPYRALLAVDVRDFSGYPGGDHAELTARIRPIVAAAFHRCGLVDVWEDEIWHRVIGDSYVAAFPSPVLPMLLNPLLRALQDQLEHENRYAPIGNPPRPIRIRASVHVGPVTDPSAVAPSADGSGDPRVETHRLLDADEVKDLLTRSGDETCVAAIVSGRTYNDAVESGYVGEPAGCTGRSR